MAKKKPPPHPILKLKPGVCRWVNPDRSYCCKPAVKKKAWCEEHYKIVYVPSGP